MENIDLIRGDTRTLTYEVTDADDNAVNISGWEIWLTVRNQPANTSESDDSDADISKHQTIVDGASGKFSFKLDPADTDLEPGVYNTDIQTKDAGGDIVSSPAETITIKADVTRSN